MPLFIRGSPGFRLQGKLASGLMERRFPAKPDITCSKKPLPILGYVIPRILSPCNILSLYCYLRKIHFHIVFTLCVNMCFSCWIKNSFRVELKLTDHQSCNT